MRIPALAALLLAAAVGGASALVIDTGDGWTLAASSPNFATGTGAAPGRRADPAVYLTRTACCGGSGVLQKTIAVDEAWHGKRVRLALRLRDDGDATSSVWFQMTKTDGSVIQADAQANAFGARYWQSHEFVMDVPSNAAMLTVGVNLSGAGKAWVDNVSLETVQVEPRAGRPVASGGNYRFDGVGNFPLNIPDPPPRTFQSTDGTQYGH